MVSAYCSAISIRFLAIFVVSLFSIGFFIKSLIPTCIIAHHIHILVKSGLSDGLAPELSSLEKP